MSVDVRALAEEALRRFRDDHGLRPFVVAPLWVRDRLDKAPLGWGVPEENVFDPLREATAPLLRRLERLDALTFGPEGMPMPRWLFFGGAEMPSAILGLARPASALSAHARELLQIPAGDDTLVPYSMYIAVPMLHGGSIMGHNLASVNRALPEERLAGLASATKALGIAALRARYVYGATQWRSHALGVHVRFGALELVTAFTPAHSNPRTLTYKFAATKDALFAAAAGLRAPVPPKGTRWIDADDEPALRKLHDALRAGERHAIIGAPKTDGDRVLLPIARIGESREG